MAMAFRSRPSPCSIGSRYGSQALADGSGWLGGPWFPEGASPESVVTSMAGFSGARRPHPVSVTGRPSGQMHCDALCGARRIFSGFRYEGPGQEFLDAVDRMIGDAGQHVAEIRFGVETVEFGGADQTVNRGGALTDSIGAGEKEDFHAKSDATQCSFGGVVVDLDAAIVHVTQQCVPARERVAHRQRRVGFPR